MDGIKQDGRAIDRSNHKHSNKQVFVLECDHIERFRVENPVQSVAENNQNIEGPQ
jgi:hypothetical protein